MGALDEDTMLESAGGGRWQGRLSDRWNIGSGVNGGYLASFVLSALRAESPAPDPLTMTVHYVEAPEPGPAAVATDVVRVGRAHSTVSARLFQDGDKAIAAALATFGRWREPSPVDFQPQRPDASDPERGITLDHPSGPDMSLLDRFEHRVASPEDHFFSRSSPGPALSGGWIRLADRALDALAVPLVMDSFPPAVFSTFLGGGAPTIELTVHWRGRPRTTWHLGRFASRTLTGGYVEEDGELWDQDGRLVAQSRQLARFLPPG